MDNTSWTYVIFKQEKIRIKVSLMISDPTDAVQGGREVHDPDPRLQHPLGRRGAGISAKEFSVVVVYHVTIVAIDMGC